MRRGSGSSNQLRRWRFERPLDEGGVKIFAQFDHLSVAHPDHVAIAVVVALAGHGLDVAVAEDDDIVGLSSSLTSRFRAFS